MSNDKAPERNSLHVNASDQNDSMQLEIGKGEDPHLEDWEGFEYSPLEITPVLSINFSDEFRHVFGLLYAVMASTERSDRVLRLTNRAIKLNPGNPTAWMLRREVVTALAVETPTSTWNKELAFTSSIIAKNHKNYQAWEHRRFCAESGKLLRAELEFIDVVLNEDEKNYHAWSHRQWLVRKHGMYDGELATTEWFIRADIRNNSAWNHRWLVSGLIEGRRNIAELNFATEIVQEAPRNESVWNYIHALGKSGVCIDAAKAKALECLEVDAGCLPARRFLILNGSASDADDVKRHCDVLAAGVDPVRKKYWQAQAKAAATVLDR